MHHELDKGIYSQSNIPQYSNTDEENSYTDTYIHELAKNMLKIFTDLQKP